MKETTHLNTISYKKLIHFLWTFIRQQHWTFFFILVQDCINCFDSLLWPFILRWVIDIFTLNEVNRSLAWEPLKVPLIGTLPVFFQSFGIAKQAYSVMLDPQDMGDKPQALDFKIQKGEIVFERD